MSAALAHEFTRASGAGVADCCFIAQRYPEADGCFRPGRGESFVGMTAPDRVRLGIGGPGWFTGIWRAADRTIYVSDVAGRVYTLPRGEGDRWHHVDLPGSLFGVWGADDACVWTWGALGAAPVLYHFDGAHWRAQPAPGEVVTLHGPHRDLVFAVGHRGLVARWDGAAWARLECPVRETVSGVCVVSEAEAYAITPGGTWLEGSAGQWRLGARREHMLYSVAAHRGVVYAGAPFPDGLLTLGAAGLETRERELDPYQMDTRGDLLLATPYVLASSPDADAWTRLPVSALEALLAGVAPAPTVA